MFKFKMFNLKCLILVLIVLILIVLIYLKFKNLELFKPDFSDYTIDRIQTEYNTYGYCIGGNVKCNKGASTIIGTYNGGNTYQSYCDDGSNIICDNNLQFDISDNIIWHTPKNVKIEFSNSQTHINDMFGRFKASSVRVAGSGNFTVKSLGSIRSSSLSPPADFINALSFQTSARSRNEVTSLLDDLCNLAALIAEQLIISISISFPTDFYSMITCNTKEAIKVNDWRDVSMVSAVQISSIKRLVDNFTFIVIEVYRWMSNLKLELNIRFAELISIFMCKHITSMLPTILMIDYLYQVLKTFQNIQQRDRDMLSVSSCCLLTYPLIRASVEDSHSSVLNIILLTVERDLISPSCMSTIITSCCRKTSATYYESVKNFVSFRTIQPMVMLNLIGMFLFKFRSKFNTLNLILLPACRILQTLLRRNHFTLKRLIQQLIE